jgi:NAD(P)-dependent dehydrogenase (short-subunit alcohol dehydrogenase family)
VAVLSRTRAQLDQVVAQIEATGGSARALVADVTDRAAVEAAVAEAERSLGPVSILVNNAGRALPYGPIGVVDPDEWWRSHSIHVRGTLLCASAVLPGMRARRSGCIVNIASKVASSSHRTCRRTASRRPPVIRLTEHIDAEAKADGVRAFVVQPGTISTDMARESIGNPEAHKWVPFLVQDLEKSSRRTRRASSSDSAVRSSRSRPGGTTRSRARTSTSSTAPWSRFAERGAVAPVRRARPKLSRAGAFQRRCLAMIDVQARRRRVMRWSRCVVPISDSSEMSFVISKQKQLHRRFYFSRVLRAPSGVRTSLRARRFTDEARCESIWPRAARERPHARFGESD